MEFRGQDIDIEEDERPIKIEFFPLPKELDEWYKQYAEQWEAEISKPCDCNSGKAFKDCCYFPKGE